MTPTETKWRKEMAEQFARARKALDAMERAEVYMMENLEGPKQPQAEYAWHRCGKKLDQALRGIRF